MKLDEGWNQIQFNLSDFTRRAYGSNYVETLRLSIHANCRIRRIYFCDRLYSEEDLPLEFKLFVPSSKTVKKVYQPPKPKVKSQKMNETTESQVNEAHENQDTNIVANDVHDPIEEQLVEHEDHIDEENYDL